MGDCIKLDKIRRLTSIVIVVIFGGFVYCGLPVNVTLPSFIDSANVATKSNQV